MKFRPQKLAAAIVVAAALSTAGGAVAQTVNLDQTAGEIERTASSSPQRAATRMAVEFSALTGSEKEALELIEGLRRGTPVVLDDNSPTSTVVTPKSGTGYGNVFISLALAQASLSKSGIDSPNDAQLASALNAVLAKRSTGMGWGEVVKELDLKLGVVVSSIKSGHDRLAGALKAKESREKGAPARADDKLRPAKPERPEKPEKPGRPEKTERPERAGGRP